MYHMYVDKSTGPQVWRMEGASSRQSKKRQPGKGEAEVSGACTYFFTFPSSHVFVQKSCSAYNQFEDVMTISFPFLSYSCLLDLLLSSLIVGYFVPF